VSRSSWCKTPGTAPPVCKFVIARRLRWKSLVNVRSVFADELLDGNSHKEPLDSLPRRSLSGSATECDGLEDSPCAHTIDNASRLAPGLPGRACDKLPDQVAGGVASLGSPSQHRLHVFEKLPDLRLWKTEDNPSQRRQESIQISDFRTHSRQKIRTDHLQAVASRLIAPKH